MEQVIAFITRWLTGLLDAVGSLVGAAIAVFDWPADVIGIPPEILAAALLCLVLIALWRALGGLFT